MCGIIKYNIIKTGQEVKLKTSPIDPHDAFRGKYVSLNFREILPTERNGKYGTILIDENGFAKISKITDKPSGDLYIKSKSNRYFNLPLDRYYMDEILAPKAEAVTQRQTTKNTYITAKIKNGNAVITGLFIDNVAIEDYITNME